MADQAQKSKQESIKNEKPNDVPVSDVDAQPKDALKPEDSGVDQLKADDVPVTIDDN